MPIEIPEVSPKRQLTRKIFEALISEIPLGGAYAAMLSQTHPAKAEVVQAEWRLKVTETVNQLEKLLDQLVPEITLSDLATAIGFWISKTSEFGLTDPIRFSDIQAQFPDSKEQDIEDACGELGNVGLATLSHLINGNVRTRPTNELFEAFDPVVFTDANPRNDAAHLARYILEKNDGVGAQEVMSHFSWSIRRYNPAMGIVSSMIGEGRKSAEVHPTISCLYVHTDPQERVELRRFANAVLGK